MINKLFQGLFKHIDSFLMGCLLFTLLVGLFVLYSASGENASRVTAQLVNIAVAIMVLWLVSNIQPQLLERIAPPLYLLGRIEGREAIGGMHGAGGDAPVARRRVVHRVVEARGRDHAVVGSERLADRVAVLAVAAGGGEDCHQVARIAPGSGCGLEPGGKRKAHAFARPPALGRGQRFRGRQDRGPGGEPGAPGEDLARILPAREPRADHPDALDARRELHAARGRRPKTRLQLEPPNPNELLNTRSTLRCCPAIA